MHVKEKLRNELEIRLQNRKDDLEFCIWSPQEFCQIHFFGNTNSINLIPILINLFKT